MRFVHLKNSARVCVHLFDDDVVYTVRDYQVKYARDERNIVELDPPMSVNKDIPVIGTVLGEYGEARAEEEVAGRWVRFYDYIIS